MTPYDSRGGGAFDCGEGWGLLLDSFVTCFCIIGTYACLTKSSKRFLLSPQKIDKYMKNLRYFQTSCSS